MAFLVLIRRKDAVSTLTTMLRYVDGTGKEENKREKRETKGGKHSKDFHLAVERIRRPPVHPWGR